MKEIIRQTKWTREMDAKLRLLWPRHPGIEIAAIMGLSEHRIWTRARNLRLGKRRPAKLREPTPEQWEAAARMAAALANVGIKEILMGEKRWPVAHARWRAFKAVLDTDKRISIGGLSRVSGFHHSSILHGLRRLEGYSRDEIIADGKASGRAPAFLEAA